MPGASRWAELEGKGGSRRGAGGLGIRWHLRSCIIIAMVLIKNQSPPNEPPATTILALSLSLPSTPAKKLGDGLRPVCQEGREGHKQEGAGGESRKRSRKHGGRQSSRTGGWAQNGQAAKVLWETQGHKTGQAGQGHGRDLKRECRTHAAPGRTQTQRHTDVQGRVTLPVPREKPQTQGGGTGAPESRGAAAAGPGGPDAQENRSASRPQRQGGPACRTEDVISAPGPPPPQPWGHCPP